MNFVTGFTEKGHAERSINNIFDRVNVEGLR